MSVRILAAPSLQPLGIGGGQIRPVIMNGMLAGCLAFPVGAVFFLAGLVPRRALAVSVIQSPHHEDWIVVLRVTDRVLI